MGYSFLFKKTTAASIHKPLLRLNSHGSMLVQVLISAGLTAALALTLASLLLQQNKQIKLMEQKSEIIDIKNEILMALSNPQVCGCNLNPSKLIPLGTKPAIEFSSSPATFNLAEGLRADCEISTPTFLKSGKKTLSNLNVDHIKIASLTQVGATNNWNGRLEVKFSGSNIQLKDLSMPINVESSGSGPFQVDTCSLTAEHSVKIKYSNITTHMFCNTHASGTSGTILKSNEKNRICYLSAVDDDSTVVVSISEAKCRIGNDGNNWVGYAPLACGQVFCQATCYDIVQDF